MQAKKPKILSLVWYQFLPANFGGQQRIASFNEALSKNVELICLCSKNNNASAIDSYAVYPLLPNTKLQVINPFTWIFIIQFCKKENITHVIIEHPYHVITSFILKYLYSIKIIHASHNIEFERFKLLKKWYWKVLLYAEKWLCSFADLSIFITKQDQQKAINFFKISNRKSMVIPHGITRKNVQEKKSQQQQIKAALEIPEEHNIFLFNGTLDYLPNVKAVEAIAALLIPYLNNINKNYTILITGRIELIQFQYLKQYQNNQLKILGNVSNSSDYFLAADVYINPVLIGGGVQTKTLEALSYNLPVITFKHMLQGIEETVTRTNIISINENDWQSFAANTWQAILNRSKIPNEFFEYYAVENYMAEFLKKIKQL